MHCVLLLIVTSCFVTEGLCAKCMSPDDARYITPAFPVPEKWRDIGWHTGNYFPAPESDGGFSTVSSFLLTSIENSIPLWWLKDRDTKYHSILTKDMSHILCTLMGAGLQIGWAPVNSETKRSGYCHWNITTHPRDISMFQLRNVELHSIEEISTVFLDRSGLYFDYATNSENDPENVVENSKTWWRWAPNRNLTDMEDLPEQCKLTDSGIPLFLEDSEIMGRSLGNRRRRSRIPFITLTSADQFARCGDRWYLYMGKCYRLYTDPGLQYKMAARVCTILRGKIAQPTSLVENDFVRDLIRVLTYKKGRREFWLRATVHGSVLKPTIKDFEIDGVKIKYTKWQRNMRMSIKQRCILMSRGTRGSRGSWVPSNCNIATGRVLCQRDAQMNELPGSATCGKIQARGLDATMASKAFTSGDNRIVGGNDASLGQFPWQAAIRFVQPVKVRGYSKRVYHNCGGALIDNCWVLTAAHCFSNRNENSYRVRLGDLRKNSRDGTEQEFDIERLIIHRLYTDIPSHRQDIALIKLRRNSEGECAVFNVHVQPACLPTIEYDIADDGARCQVSGWGVTNTSIGQASAADTLQYVTVPTMSDDICRARYNKKNKPSYFLRSVMFCAGYKDGGRDSCSGDSGGPYVCRGKNGRYAVAGIVSFGIGCARKSYPGVYTRVREFIPWINEKMSHYGDNRSGR